MYTTKFTLQFFLMMIKMYIESHSSKTFISAKFYQHEALSTQNFINTQPSNSIKLFTAVLVFPISKPLARMKTWLYKHQHIYFPINQHMDETFLKNSLGRSVFTLLMFPGSVSQNPVFQTILTRALRVSCQPRLGDDGQTSCRAPCCCYQARSAWPQKRLPACYS